MAMQMGQEILAERRSFFLLRRDVPERIDLFSQKK
jgi:hypothetical protein